MRDVKGFSNRSSSRRMRGLIAAAVGLALLASACGSDAKPDTTAGPEDPVAAAQQRVTAAESGATQADADLTAAHANFCTVGQDYVEKVDRYGRVFTDKAATVGDINTLGADLVAPRDEVVPAAGTVETAKDALAAAQQELVDAQAALVDAIATASTAVSEPTTTVTPTTSTTTTLVPQATIERVQQAEDDLARVSKGISDTTPLVEAAANYNSAALEVQIAWLRLLDDAKCLTDEQQANAAEQLFAYTTALQTDLATAGYDPGPIDGIYGPATVAAVEQLQTDSNLRVTGLVDEATARALQTKLVAAGQAQSQQTVQLQTILSLAGYWTGPIDGVWSDELTQSLMAFQTALGVAPSGVVDAATIAAFQIALADLKAGSPPTTTPVEPPTTTTPTATTVAPAPDATTVVVTDSALGKILTTADGTTVYLYVPDAQGAPTCTDACAQSWPPLTVDDPAKVTGGAGVDATLLATAQHPTAGTQVTYNGWPLYTFKGDTKPGDTTGQGQGGVWYVLDPTGNAIGKP